MRAVPPKLYTAKQWLASSVAWTAICLSCWVLLALILLVVLAGHNLLLQRLLLGSAIIGHGLVWWKGYTGSWVTRSDSGEWSLELAARLWLVGLTLFQLVSLFLLIDLLLTLALGSTTDSGWGL